MSQPDARSQTTPFRWGKNELGDQDRALFIRRLYVGCIHKWTAGPHAEAGTPWRVWIVDVCDEGHVGWFETEAQAACALEDAVRRAMADA